MTAALTRWIAEDTRRHPPARVRLPRHGGNVRTALWGEAFAIVLTGVLASVGHGRLLAEEQGMLVRISEIRVDAKSLQEYTAILKEEAEASVRLEPGVVAIFPMYQNDDRTAVRILEIYASREAYEAHLKTPHFQRYKTTTLKMVTSLKLVDMGAIDREAMTRIFEKMKR
jgi:quinol monooxygenase YgiN